MLPPQRPVIPGGPVSGRVRPPVYPRLFRLSPLSSPSSLSSLSSLRRPTPGGATVGAEGGSRTRISVLPRLRTAVVRHRRGVPARGVAPLFLPCHGSGLRLTYAGSWSGSGDLHAAVPAPQAGGTLSSPEPVVFSSSRLRVFASSLKGGTLFVLCPLLAARCLSWGDRPESHRLRSGSRPDGSTLCLRPPYWSALVVTLHGLPLIKGPVCF